MHKRVLFISNGHGEDNDSGYIIRALRRRDADVQADALPLVGRGAEYRKLDVPVLGPAQEIPSGGFTYTNRLLLLRDIRAGLLGQTVGQYRALRRSAGEYDLVVATGDVVSQSFGYASGRPYISFISSLSALYEGRLRIGPVLRRTFRARRCVALVTKDRATAQDMERQGFDNVVFGGIPSLDWIVPEGRDLSLAEGDRMAALLPGSRIAEAERNFALMLRFVELAAAAPGACSVRFRAALVPRLHDRRAAIAQAAGWSCDGACLSGPGGTEVLCYSDAYNDIASRCDIVIGMAGLAVEQAAALGKPAILIPGKGPQFTYAFAEAQNRMLGMSAQTIGTGPATEATLRDASACLHRTLADDAYLAAARASGLERLGALGGAGRIADLIVQALTQSQTGAPPVVAAT